MTKLWSILLAALLLGSCTRVQPVVEGPDPLGDPLPTETEAEPKETDPAETEPAEAEPVKTEAPAASAAERIISGKFAMVNPVGYPEIYKKIRENNNWRGYNGRFAVEEEAVAEADFAVEAPMEAPMPTAEMAVAEKGADAGWGSDDYSETNVQVKGIDEADIVKTDGRYLYVLNNQYRLLILSAAGAGTELISETTVGDGYDYWADVWDGGSDEYKVSSWRNPREIYIWGDTLALVCECGEYGSGMIDGIWRYEDKSYTVIDFYDVSDRSAPKLLNSEGQDGYYTSSRLKDGKIYLITRRYVNRWDDFKEGDYDDYVPGLYRDGEFRILPADRIVWPETSDGSDYTIVSRISAESRMTEETLSVLGAGSQVYMSGEYLYLADARYFDEELSSRTESVYTVTDYVSGNRTEFLKLRYEDAIEVTASGYVEGDLLNQFSMDEYDGYFRVVTTNWNSRYSVYEDPVFGFVNYKYADSSQFNGLYIFDGELNLVGSVPGLAEDERVYSVRFDGKVGYFVTFRQVDPLFTVDLTDPANPVVMSALKIPGFSNYLHPYSDGLLFGLGQNADEETGRTNGMKLSMFDVSDPFNVFERDKISLTISYSEGLYNHKAILVAPSKGLIGFPSENGYLLYTYAEGEGFRLFDEVKINEEDGWWWDSSSRGLYAGDAIYIVTSSFTVVLDMNTGDLLTRVGY